MNHQISNVDREFVRKFAACEIAPAEFDHAAHVRLAYVYLCDGSIESAAEKMKQSLLAFLVHFGISASKYHETITRAWIMAVHYFMGKSQGFPSAAAFIGAHPELLDSKIMLTHYSAEVLFSPTARQSFVEPDIQSIPPPRAQQ